MAKKKPEEESKEENSKLIEELTGGLTDLAKCVQDAGKEINDFHKELKKAKDMESKELEKVILKRQQMFFRLGNAVDKYNSTAKGVIQNLR
jgi:hypothetical protein